MDKKLKLADLFRHNVRIECDNGLMIEGYVDMHTSELDNDPDPESICIANYELFKDDIKKATILD